MLESQLDRMSFDFSFRKSSVYSGGEEIGDGRVVKPALTFPISSISTYLKLILIDTVPDSAKSVGRGVDLTDITRPVGQEEVYNQGFDYGFDKLCCSSASGRSRPP